MSVGQSLAADSRLRVRVCWTFCVAEDSHPNSPRAPQAGGPYGTRDHILAKVPILEIWHVLKIQKTIFSKNKRPLREATTIGYLFRIYPKRINSFLQRSQKWGVPQNFDFLMVFISRNAFLPENQNGPYGPYEQLLKDGKGNYWRKKWVRDQK